jgi:hypothetical protein
MSEHKISLTEVEALFRGRLGLVFGPGITVSSHFFEHLAMFLAEKWGGQLGQTYLQVAQQALGQGVSPGDVRTAIMGFLKPMAGVAHLQRIANVKWSAALSLTLDIAFEEALARACERRPSGFTATQVVELPQALPPKTVPVFKLLGNAEQNIVYSEISYTGRRPKWRYAVQEFADRIQDNPVVCLGLEGCHWLLLDLLSQMLSEPRTIMRPLLLLESEFDGIAHSSIMELCQDRTQVSFIDGTLAELISRIKDVEEAGTTIPLALPKAQTELDRLAPFQDIVAPVNWQLKSPIGKGERAQLLDLLFSPALPRWDPFFHKLDFRRSLGNQMLDALMKPPRVGRGLPAFSLIGSAASGKTTLAKRLAYDLASRGNPVFWLRRTFYPNVQGLLAQFFEVIGETFDKRERMFFFVDDPLRLGSLTMQGISATAKAHGIKATFVVVARTSDWRTHETQEMTGELERVQEFCLSDHFDPQELGALANYLVSLQIYADKNIAQAEIDKAPSRLTADTLGLLYWLLPKTRQAIKESIREEYLHLGERAGFSRVIIGAYNRTSAFLRRAYAMAATSEHYHTPVPVEVLVSALNVPYRDWLDSVDSEGPAWGLLYGEVSPDGQTVCYRPRNSIVTSILVDTINGGTLAHSGEVEQLSKLLSACTGTNSVYREFCVSILVPRRNLSHLDYAEGLQLYDAAISALPFDDRTLIHQKGLWIKDKGNNPLLAKEALEGALTARIYPHTERGEAEEHIHTSLAATILDAADQNKINLQQALPEILKHLDHARSDAFFNPRAVHVQANLMLRLVSRLGEADSADKYNLLNQAMDDVDSTLLVLKNPMQDARDHPAKDIDFLEDVSGRLYERIMPLDELKENASELWRNFRRQEGFVIAARKLYHTARQKNTGTAYNEAFSYCQRMLAEIQAESQVPSADLCAVAASIYYEWNVNRYDSRAVGRQIDWPMLYELSHVVTEAAKYSGDLFYQLVSAISLAQQSKWAEADFLFSKIRRARIPNDQLYEPRAVLVDKEGVRQRVQGTITGNEQRHYFKSDEIDRDFFLSRVERWPRPGEIAHAYIAFAFAGPLAVQKL